MHWNDLLHWAIQSPVINDLKTQELKALQGQLQKVADTAAQKVPDLAPVIHQALLPVAQAFVAGLATKLK